MEEKDYTNINSSDNGHMLSDSSIKSFYHKNNLMSFILKKTEKIATAIYMVTDFMSESEPLRIELRTLAISLLSKTRRLSTKATEPDYAIVDDVSHGSESIISFINLAVTIGLVSSMNGNILKKELEKNVKELVSLYSDKRVSITTHPGYANIILSEDMFNISEKEEVKKIDFNKGQEKNNPEISNNVLYNRPEKSDINKENSNTISSKTSTLGIKIARRNDVLNIVKVKGQVSVKDIVLMLKDVGEKTVQRELHSLVSEGVLRKEGEKRWSVYKLV